MINDGAVIDDRSWTYGHCRPDHRTRGNERARAEHGRRCNRRCRVYDASLRAASSSERAR